tara:strand:- start:1546 stop:2151 length:606 start_codon:yes stop_codon:yes gene_type:complete
VKKIFPYILLLFLGSCAYSGSYNPSFIPQPISYPDSQKFSGSGLIYMEVADESYIFEGRPTSFTGSATSLRLPLGNYAKQIALKVFSELFTDGVRFSNDLRDSNNYVLTISPNITSFSYAYDAASSLGFAITPEAKISMKITVFDQQAKKVFEKTYYPEKLEGDTYMFSANPDEKVNQAAHRLINNIFEQSLSDIKNNLTE